MNADRELATAFGQVRQSPIMQIDSVDAVMERIRSAPRTEILHRPVRRWRVRIVAAAIPTAAAIAFAIMLDPMLSGNRVEAQFREALVQVNSAHVVWEVERPQGRTPAREVWYQKDAGYCECRGAGAIPVELHTKEHSWTYQLGSKTALKSGPTNPAEALTKVLLGKGTLDQRNLKRIPERDAVVGGDPCKAYVMVRQVATPGANGVVIRDSDAREIYWVNGKQLIRQAEIQENVDGGWQATGWVSVSYDVKVPAGRFEPVFGEGVTVADPKRILEDRYPLQGALSVNEIGGLRMAVHEARKCEDGMFFVVSSVRPAEKTLQDYPRETTFLQNARFGTNPYGHHQVELPNGSFKTRLIALGSVAHDDLQVNWWLAIPHRPYYVEGGVRRTSPWMDREIELHKLEFQPGSVRLPVWIRMDDTRLQARYGVDVMEDVLVHFTNKEVAKASDMMRQTFTDMNALSFLKDPEVKWDPMRKKWIAGSPTGVEPPGSATELEKRYTSEIQKRVKLILAKDETSATRTVYELGPDGKLVPIGTEGPAGVELDK